MESNELNEITDLERLQKYHPLLRTCMGFTQQKFAELLRISRQMVCGIETGRNKVSRSLYQAISKIVDDYCAQSSDGYVLVKTVFLWLIESPELCDADELKLLEQNAKLVSPCVLMDSNNRHDAVRLFVELMKNNELEDLLCYNATDSTREKHSCCYRADD